jgi:zinc protease
MLRLLLCLCSAFVFCFFQPHTGCGENDEPDFEVLPASQHFILENGLEVVLLENRSSPMVGSLALVKVGSVRESVGTGGLCHLLEHLVFEGTSRRTQREIFREVHSWGGYLNGFTREDYTGYIVMAPPEHLESMLDLQADILFNSLITPERVEREKRVVLEEMVQGKARPDYRLERLFRNKMYGRAPYGREVLGTTRSMESIQPETVKECYEDYYVPNNMMLILVGSFPAESAELVVIKHFGRKPPGRVPPLEPFDTPFIGERRVFSLASSSQEGRLKIGFNAPHVGEAHYYALEVASSVLFGESGVVKQALQKSGIAAYRVEGGLQSYQGFTTLELDITFPASVDGKTVLGRLLSQIGSIASRGFPRDEVRLAKRTVRSREALLKEKIHYWAMEKATYLVAGSPGLLTGFDKGIDEVTGESMRNALETYMVEAPFVAVLSVPQGKARAEEQVSHVLPRNTVALANGLVVIAEQRPGSQVFAFHLMAKNRTCEEPEGKEGIAEFVHRLLLAGTKSRTQSEISEAVRSLGGELQVATDYRSPFGEFYTSKEYSTVRLEVLDPFAEEALGVVSDVVRNPSFPAEAVEKTRGEVRELIRERQRQASRVASSLLDRRLFSGHCLSRPLVGTAQSIASITPADLREFHAHYMRPGNLVISVVSGRAPQEAIEMVRGAFGGMDGHVAGSLTIAPTQPVQGKDVVRQPLGQIQGALLLGKVIPDVTAHDSLVLEVATSVVNATLFRHLREEQGL